jgi:nicotinate-nucleotide pyrophosphorylase (carboxylating)
MSEAGERIGDLSELSRTTTDALRDAGLEPESVAALIRAALAEDLGTAGDITSAATIPAATELRARFVSRAVGTAAGLPVLAAVADIALTPRPGSDFTALVADGDPLTPGRALAEIAGPARDVLALERTALNLVGHLGGVASVTAQWVAAIAGTGARVRDTRKTTPGLRQLDKYAVRCGGGTNHRRGLDDAILIKDNHVAAAGGIGPALDAVWRTHPRGSVVVQIEVDDLDQLDAALAHGAPQILLDNFDVDLCRQAVELIRTRAPGTIVEASGGLTLDRAHAFAATGVDYLAVGALTHSAPSLDIGLDAI